MKAWLLKVFLPRRRRYLAMILRLVREGEVELLESQGGAPANIDGWNVEDLALLIEEGRRRYEDEVATLKDIRSRAQLVLSISLVVLAALASTSSGVILRFPTMGDVVSAVGFLAGGTAALGAAAIVVVGAPMGVVSLSEMTVDEGAPSSLEKLLASQYVGISVQNRRVVRTWHTHFFESVIWLLVASACAVVGLL